MKALIQRVNYAKVETEGKVVGQIEKGLLVLLGVGHQDTAEIAEFLADKCVKLRIFSDENDKLNLSLADINGGMLVVSNFTLYADASHGRRPNYLDAAPPQQADSLYRYFAACVEDLGINPVQTGVFGADMKVSLENDGPVTIMLDTDVIYKKPR
ncbi:MAG: D-tyrosyl-tRNA(Tyr) deacylase [Ruminococcaceae bacterium]|nr:D-tyrosyl-tRNA(Tyr) deacylase [Oscillospiraceae bacterium]